MNDPISAITVAVIAAIIVVSICVLAYFVPGLVLRARRDFKNRYEKGKGETNGKMEKGAK